MNFAYFLDSAQNDCISLFSDATNTFTDAKRFLFSFASTHRRRPGSVNKMCECASVRTRQMPRKKNTRLESYSQIDEVIIVHFVPANWL